MTSATFSLAFRDDSLTTASKPTLERMAKTLGFTQNQTVLYALARLRDDLNMTAQNPSDPSAYPDLTQKQLGIVRQHAPQRKSRPVRSSSITDLL